MADINIAMGIVIMYDTFLGQVSHSGSGYRFRVRVNPNPNND